MLPHQIQGGRLDKWVLEEAPLFPQGERIEHDPYPCASVIAQLTD